MAMAETRILKEPWDVDRRLLELGNLRRDALLKVRDVAIGAAADATPFHPANAAGTLAYHHGVFSLRDQHVGEDWKVDRLDGIELIRNAKINVMIAFANVDIACNDFHEPKPKSDKGAGAERVGQGNLFGPGGLPRYAPRQDGIWSLYYLMVAEDGACELSCPVVKDNKFVAYVERIFLSDGDDPGRVAVPIEDGDSPDKFDPQVTRKRA